MKKKRKQVNCTCEAYPFIHRIDSGKCRLLYNAQQEEPAREPDSIDALGLRSLFAPDNRQYIRF